MRLFVDWLECYEEVKRDLAEMGIEVKPKTMQDKIVEGNEDFYTMELQNYSYTLLNANSKEITGVTQPWADEEFQERVDISGRVNPGKAYRHRPDIWCEYMHNGKFAYSYNERIMLGGQLLDIINRIKQDKDSRQLWLSIWSPEIDPKRLGGISRVPCSLGYNFQVRDGKLNIHYVMRSCDFNTHFINDIYLAIKLLEYVGEKTEIETGSFTHTVFSLHIYKKDIEGVF